MNDFLITKLSNRFSGATVEVNGSPRGVLLGIFRGSYHPSIDIVTAFNIWRIQISSIKGNEIVGVMPDYCYEIVTFTFIKEKHDKRKFA